MTDTTTKEPKMKIILSLCAAVVVLIFVLAANAPPPKPYTYGDLARDEAAECVRKKGLGQWRGSLGVTLEQFCQGAGNLSALMAHKKAHPEQY